MLNVFAYLAGLRATIQTFTNHTDFLYQFDLRFYLIFDCTFVLSIISTVCVDSVQSASLLFSTFQGIRRRGRLRGTCQGNCKNQQLFQNVFSGAQAFFHLVLKLDKSLTNGNCDSQGSVSYKIRSICNSQKYLQCSKVFAMLKSICNTSKYLQYYVKPNCKGYLFNEECPKIPLGDEVRVKLNERIMQKFSNALYFMVFQCFVAFIRRLLT